MSDEKKEPQVGESFYTLSEDEGESDQAHEIEEVLEENVEGTEPVWNVGSEGDFYDIKWSAANKRWEEDV